MKEQELYIKNKIKIIDEAIKSIQNSNNSDYELSEKFNFLQKRKLILNTKINCHYEIKKTILSNNDNTPIISHKSFLK